jgi:GTP-binding protein
MARPVVSLRKPLETVLFSSRFEVARKLFSGKILAHPVIVAQTLSKLPASSIPRIAVVGMSNAGKSSLINSLVGREIAIASKTAGRTRHLFTFEIGGELALVDLPGYGFAKLKDSRVKESWKELIRGFFERADNLKRIVLLLDVNQGLGEDDLKFLEDLLATRMMSSPQVMFVLTKVDSVNQFTLHDKVLETLNAMSEWENKGLAVWPYLHSISALHNLGLDELQAVICDFDTT